MSRSSMPRHPRRWRQAVAVLAIATLPFTMAACGEDEQVDVPGVDEELEDGGGEDEEDGEGDY